MKSRLRAISQTLLVVAALLVFFGGRAISEFAKMEGFGAVLLGIIAILTKSSRTTAMPKISAQ